MKSAERHTHILSLHGCRNRLAERGLADTRRTVEADDRRLEVTTKGKDGHIFKNTLLHFLHSVVILVEYLLGTLQVQVVLCIFAPGKTDEGLQIVQLYIELGTLRIQVVEFVSLFEEHFTHLVGPFLVFGLAEQLTLLRRRLAVAHLGLQVLNLLLQEVVALLLVDVLTSLVSDVGFQVLEVDLAVQNLHQAEQSFFHEFHFQKGHLLLHAERHVRTHEVQGHDIVGDILDGESSLVGNFLTDIDVLGHHVAEVFHRRTELTVFLVRLKVFYRIDDALEIGFRLDNRLEAETTQCLYDGGDIAIRQRQLFHHLSIDTNFIEVLLQGEVHVRLTLADNADDLACLLSLLYKFLAGVTPDENR